VALKHGYIGTEHLLLGLLRETDSLDHLEGSRSMSRLTFVRS
jgi:hypothetical protein